MDLKRRHFITGIAAAAGVSALDGFGLLRASAAAQSVARAVVDNPSRRLEDYPHITDTIPSRDMHRYFSLIVDACAAPGTGYLSKVPFIIELEVAKIWSESRFEWDALSAVGAAGLQQLMAETARKYDLTVIESPEFVRVNKWICKYRQLRFSTGATRQKLYRMAESGTGSISKRRIGAMNTLRAELRELDDQRAAAYENLAAARRAYRDKIRCMTPDQRKKTDARFAPELHIPVGVRHLVRGILECRDFFGGPVEMNVWRGIAAYNSGLARVKTWGGLPFIEETVHFTRNVVSDLTRTLEMKYAYANGDAALIAETRMRLGLRKPYFMYVVKVGDTFFRIVREQIMERYELTFADALKHIRDGQGNEVNPKDMSTIFPDQQFRIYVPE